MPYNPNKHHRQSIRLKNYDYTSSGAYFITICTEHRDDTLSIIQNNTANPTEIGQIIQNTWNELPNRFNIQTDEFMIMPDHVHGIIIINPANPKNPIHDHDQNPVRDHDQNPVRDHDQNPVRDHDQNPIHDHDQNPVGALLAAPINAGLKGQGQGQGAASSAPTSTTTKTKQASLSEIIRAFKSISAIGVNKHLGRSGVRFWQRNFYEVIVRDDVMFEKIARYIRNNPTKWLEARGVIGVEAALVKLGVDFHVR